MLVASASVVIGGLWECLSRKLSLEGSLSSLVGISHCVDHVISSTAVSEIPVSGERSSVWGGMPVGWVLVFI